MWQKMTDPDGGELRWWSAVNGHRASRRKVTVWAADGAVSNVPGVPPSECMRIGVAPEGGRAPPCRIGTRLIGEWPGGRLDLSEGQGDHGMSPRAPCASRNAPSGSACHADIGTMKHGWPTAVSRRCRNCSALGRVWFMW